MRTGSSLIFPLCALLPALVLAQSPAPPRPLGDSAAAVPAARTASPEVLDEGETNPDIEGAIVIPPPAPLPVPPPATSDSATVAADTATAAPPSPPDVFTIRNPFLSRLDLSGTLQLKALYHGITAERDADKRLSLQLRRFKLELDGAFDSHSGFRGEFLVDGNENKFGVDNAYLRYTVNEFVGFMGGKLRRPFSQEALQSSNSLYTIERGQLYQNFLTHTTGYASFDLGLVAYGGFQEEGRILTYEIGIFNGKQNDSVSEDYGGQQDENLDEGFKAKDLVMRLTVAPFRMLKLDGAVSTKAAEDKSDPYAFDYAVNTAYGVGADLSLDELRLMGEAAWGDNQYGLDSRIIGGGTQFFTFYLMGVWHENYARGRASELVLKVEALDPNLKDDEAEGLNDGKFLYTVGVNYFFTPQMCVMADYGMLQPITKVRGEKDWTHDLDLLWRMSF